MQQLLHHALILLLLFTALPGRADELVIEHMKNNVYRFSTGSHHSVFMVTEAGIFVADPISRDAARTLKRELASRFDQPVRYLVYSHNHVDHSSGGDELAGAGVTVVAQTRAADDLRRTRAPTAYPDLTFSDEAEISLGDSRVELRHYGPNNGRGSISMRFMPARVMFVVDWIVVGRMPYKDLPGYDIEGMIRSTRALLDGPDFDLFIGGHADAGTRADVERYLAYLEALYAAVRDGMLAGKSLETLQTSIKLPEFDDLKMYDAWLPLNVAGVYRTLNDMSYMQMRSDLPQSD